MTSPATATMSRSAISSIDRARITLVIRNLGRPAASQSVHVAMPRLDRQQTRGLQKTQGQALTIAYPEQEARPDPAAACVIDAEESRRWEAGLNRATVAGGGFFGANAVMVSGRRPTRLSVACGIHEQQY